MARYQLLDRGVFDFTTRQVVLPGSVAWADYEASLSAGEVPLPLDPIGQQTLDEAKAARCAEINAWASGLRNKVIAGRSAGELASWALKLFDAMAVAAGQPSPFAAVLPTIGTSLGLPTTPHSYNDAIGMVRGISEAAHVGKVLAQAVPFLVAEAAIDGTRGRHCDAILAMATVQEIVAYDWHVGWPVIP